MKYPKQESIDALKEEINRARNKHPSNAHLLAALTEEVGELNKAYLEADYEHAKTEAIQVACVALRVLEEGDSAFQKKDDFHLFDELNKYIQKLDSRNTNLSLSTLPKVSKLEIKIFWQKILCGFQALFIPEYCIQNFEYRILVPINSSPQEMFLLLINKIEEENKKINEIKVENYDEWVKELSKNRHTVYAIYKNYGFNILLSPKNDPNIYELNFNEKPSLQFLIDVINNRIKGDNIRWDREYDIGLHLPNFELLWKRNENSPFDLSIEIKNYLELNDKCHKFDSYFQFNENELKIVKRKYGSSDILEIILIPTKNRTDEAIFDEFIYKYNGILDQENFDLEKEIKNHLKEFRNFFLIRKDINSDNELVAISWEQPSSVKGCIQNCQRFYFKNKIQQTDKDIFKPLMGIE